MRGGFTFMVILVLVGSLLPIFHFNKKKEVEPFATESFIKKWLTNDNGTLATYLKDGKLEDVDLVKGREALSESLGLWMEYVLQKEDRALFEDSYEIMNRYFLKADGFINWKLTENGQSEVFANALVDDLRICSALFQASEKWDDPRYEETAIHISNYLTHFNVYNNTLTDYYVTNDDYPSQVITLSYIEPGALAQLNNRNLIDKAIYENMLTLLKSAPMDGSFYPKAYNVESKKYLYDTKINLIDQALVALYRAKSGFPTEPLLNFIKKEFKQNGTIMGQYDRLTEMPIVEYESPAIYGWLILYSLEIGEEELAKGLFQRMIKFKSHNSTYYGGYSIYQEDTHIFDNLVPLIAERKMTDMGLV